MKKYSNSKEPEFKRGLTEEEINSPEFNPDDFAPAPEQAMSHNENESLENKQNAIVFALIAAFFALIVGLVGFLVSGTVATYTENKTQKLALEMFSNCDRVEKYDIDSDEFKVYAVFYKQKMAGYCVFTTVDGFGGEIDLVVAFNSDNMISGTKVLSHSESKGLGSKIEKDDFLSQFTGLLIGNSSIKYDLVSGATTSSKAVGDGVSAVLELGLSTESIANELGYETITEAEIEEEVKKEEEEGKDTPDTKDPSETTGNSGPGVGDFQGGANVNDGDGDMNLDGEDETTVYETETKKPDDEETTEAETTKKEEETTKAPDTTEADTTKAPDTTDEVTTEPPVDTTAPEDTTDAVTDPPVTDTDTTDASGGETEPIPAGNDEEVR